MSAKGIVLPKIDVVVDPQTNPSTSQQRMFLHATLGWGYLDDTNTFIPFGTGASGSSTDEIYIDTLPIAIGKYPMGNIVGLAKRYLAYMETQGIDSFVANHKTRVFKKVNATGVYSSEDFQFTTLAEIETYVNSNFANDGSDFTENGYVLFFDTIISSIPTITNASAVNSIFNSFADGAYKSHNQTAKFCDFFDATMATVFNALHGTALTSGDFGNSTARSSFWLPRNYKLYNKPYIHFSSWKTHIEFNGINGQRYYHDGVSFSQATGADNDWEVSGCYMATFDSDGNLNDIYNFDSSSERFAFAKHIIESKLRYISFYGLYSRNNSARKSVIIKPVGIDQITMMMFDKNKYDLQVVSRGNTDNAIYEHNLSIGGSHEDAGSNRIRVNIQDWMIRYTNMSKRGLTTRGLPDLYFRLKDKTTGEVGKLSDFYIHTINKGNCGNGQTTFGFVIKNDKK